MGVHWLSIIIIIFTKKKKDGIGSLGEGVWRGSPNSLESSRGVIILGTPVGHPAFVKAELQKKLQEQNKLLEAIPLVSDVQSAWLLLLYCGSSRANYLCRVLDPDSSEEYAVGHDANLLKCLQRILQIRDDMVAPIWIFLLFIV